MRRCRNLRHAIVFSLLLGAVLAIVAGCSSTRQRRLETKPLPKTGDPYDLYEWKQFNPGWRMIFRRLSM
jgi:hypothetical protein